MTYPIIWPHFFSPTILNWIHFITAVGSSDAAAWASTSGKSSTSVITNKTRALSNNNIY